MQKAHHGVGPAVHFTVIFGIVVSATAATALLIYPITRKPVGRNNKAVFTL